MNLKPSLLFGMPRPGTPWLGKVFDSQPATLYRHEPDSGGALDGVLPMSIQAHQLGWKRLLVPSACADEASLVSGIEIHRVP